MLESVSGFDWDAGNKQKCQAHGVTIAEVEELFHGVIDVFPDGAHSTSETRFLGIGRTVAGRHVFIAFTFRSEQGRRLVRPISARFMHAKEVRHYAAQIARRKD